MIKISNKKCYSVSEIVATLGRDFPARRTEHLRALGLIPRPIKVGKGKAKGTVGYYPDFVIKHLREIEKRNRRGESYRKLAVAMRGKTLSVSHKMQKIKDGYKVKKFVEQGGAYPCLIGTEHTGASLKLLKGDTLISKSGNFDDQIKRLKNELESLFCRKGNTAMVALQKMKRIIDEIYSLEATKAVLFKLHGKLPRQGKE